jgi:hypothetical protein
MVFLCVAANFALLRSPFPREIDDEPSTIFPPALHVLVLIAQRACFDTSA